MTFFRRSALAALIALSLAAGALSFDARPVLAQDAGLEAVGSEIGLSAEDPRLIAARIINIALGFLGIITLVIILYAGFQWMTSGGDADKVAQAQRRLRNAVIGLIIILSSYALTSFIVRSLTEATGFGEGTGVGAPSGPGGPLPGGGGAAAFQLRSITPSGSVPIRNVEVRFLFTRSVDPASAAGAIQVLRASDSTPVEGAVSTDGSTVTFVPSAPCPAPNEDRRCFDADTEFIARVSTALRSTGGTALVCGGFAPACEGRFTTGNLVDTADPTATIEYPLDGQGVPVDDLILVRTRATDDAGLSHVETFVDGSSIGTGTGPDSSSPFVATVEWDTTGLSTGGRSLMSRAFDLDSNTADSASIGVVVRPRHCFNGVQDEDETAVDCGGASCGACSGGSCTSGSMCASGVCVGGVCVEQPVIVAVSPDDGRVGTLVSIAGSNFGSTPGTVTFADGRAASAPAACSAAGVPTWTPTLVVVSVPEGAIDGPILLENASGLRDATNDERGPVLDDFDVNDVARPGLCAVRPSSGVAGDRIELVGVGLGASSGRVQFNDRDVSSFLSWNDELVAMNVPVFSPATYAVRAIAGGVESNRVAFRLDERVVTAAPVIDSIDPAAGPIGEYITLQGRNFGSRTGRVLFRRGDGEGVADTDFPEQCSLAFWTGTAVTVKVPRTYRAGLGDSAVTAGDWQVVLERQDTVESNAFGFTVNADAPRPGVCAIRPGAGPVGTSVEIIGERFGSVASGQASFAGPGDTRAPMSVAASDWTPTRIAGSVPTGAITGNVRVRQGTIDSNGVPFAVRNCNEDASICSAGEICCRSGACSVGSVCEAASPEAEFAWQLSTGILPVNPRVVEECSPDRPASPSPWSGRTGGDRACVNTDLYIRFTTPINPASVVLSGPGATFLVRECIGSDPSNPCAEASDPVPPAAGTGLRVGAEGDPDTGNGYIRFRPAALWDGNSTYQVILTTGIRSNTNVPMLENASRCGAGNAYCFTFGTRDATDTCRIGSINVVPESATLADIGATRDELAVPRAEGDVCLNLRSDAFDWRWSASDARVEISNETETRSDGSVRGLEEQTATARAETGADATRVTASVTQDGETVSGIGRVFVRLQPPRVVAFGPNCDEACLNAAAWARFNTAIEASTVTGNVLLRRCVNENCLSYDMTLDMSRAVIRVTRAPDTTSEALTYLIVEPVGAGGTTLLETGRFYRITLRGGDLTGIRSTNGLPLAGLNDPEGFSWTFRVREGDDARCATARVLVIPGEKFETAVGARQTFAATPISGPNACDATGSPLISDRTFAWTIDQPAPVSRYINGGTGTMVRPGLVDTTPTLPAGCSGRCLNRGSDGVAGRTASCGNGVVETTNARYCAGGRTPFGDACTLLPPGSRGGEECDEASTLCGADCRWRPMTGGTCGNGRLDRGEQCDEGPGGGRGCSAECQLLGSRLGGSTCGNNDVAAGEACDDGNTTSGDGCSADCLHEGSIRVRALCGNGVREPGESCERPVPGAPFPAGCNTTTCLNEGTTPPECGNGRPDPGEDCDDGNLVSGDGCSSRCLAEGSSAGYSVPSFCGDGVRGRGELCEAPATGGDGRPDPVQLAEILGEGEPDADGRMSSQIVADYDAQRGNAIYGLQCGYSEESSCPVGTGLDARGCCAPRPTLVSQYPTPGETGVCRNVMVSAVFGTQMNEGSVSANFVFAHEVTGATCPAGTERVASIEDYDPTPGMRGWLNRTWHRLLSWFRPPSADAAWCAGSARGRLEFLPEGDGTRVNFVLERALATSTRYQVLFRGDTNLADNGDPSNRVGVRTARGVVADGNFLWDFTTGARLCAVTTIYVRDTNTDSPNLFTTAGESHLYTAEVISLQDGRRIALSPVAEYTWAWEPWVASNREVLDAEVGTGTDTASRSNVSVVSPPRNGASFIEAGIRIVRDDVNVPSTTGRIVKGAQNATVLLCENPWPDRALAPFSEVSGHPSLELLGTSPLAAAIRSFGPYFNFATMYCRDAGEPGTAGDLPAMSVQPVEVARGDRELGILRQYLFTFDVPALRGDGIGIRVATNPLHLSPSAWYASRGFTGTPEAVTVDGYEAVKDGTTWYVGAVNTADAASATVYSQIYILSHNPDAKPETRNIVEQLVRNLTLNANIQGGASNACAYAVAEGTHVPGELYRGTDGRIARCTADWECLAQNPNLRCASFKSKMQRDSKRIVDFQYMTEALETSNERAGRYPQLQVGTFVPTLSTSRWPSWSAQFQSEVGASFPTDPVNRYLSCGVCSESGSPCQDGSECPSGQACSPVPTQPGVEPSTCWNPDVRQYQCPSLTPGVRESASRVYQYRSINAGQRYELATELEGALASRYFPPLLTEIRRCSNVNSPCVSNDDCRVFNAAGTVISTGTCNATGGSWRYHGVCEASSIYGVGGNICGDGVIGSAEVCELGDTRPEACTLTGGAAGTKLQICDDCRGWIDGPDTRCIQNVQCGNGRVDAGEICDDGALNGTYGRCNTTCTGYDAFCGDGRRSPGETCDLGASNGAYCRSSCDASTSCSLSCTGPGPRCGDGIVNGPEQCDGNAERTTSALCQGPTNPDMPCTTDADCGEDPSDQCGGTGPFGYDFNSCVGVTARRCSSDRERSCTTDADCVTPADRGARCLSYPTARVRTCKPYGGTDAPAQWCTWNLWTSCQPTSYCGDGIVDEGEQCDDGNRNNNDACTNACRNNVCGDATVYIGVEECDLGTAGIAPSGVTPQNGLRSCTADYGSSCLSCSTSCRQVASSGGFCGNGVREGSEQCDGTQGLEGISCRALGFDYPPSVVCATYGYSRRRGTEEPLCVSTTGSSPEDLFPCRSSALDSANEWVPGSYTPREVPIEIANRVCMPNQSECAPGTLCAGDHPNRRDGLTCSSSCGYTGCRMCGDRPGIGTIRAQVLDAVNYVYPVPNARVTLYNRGIRIDETHTDGDGYFEFTELDENGACVNYSIVVDFYEDNPCTGSDQRGLSCAGVRWREDSLGIADEGVNGGYWPYTSGNFSVATFITSGLRSDQAKLYLTPRIGEGEVLVMVQTNAGQTIFPSLIMPRTGAFVQTTGWNGPSTGPTRSMQANKFTYASCELDAKDGVRPGVAGYCVVDGDNDQSRPCTSDAQCGSGLRCRTGYWGCTRQVMNPQGRQDLNLYPHAEFVCRKTVDGVVTPSCHRAPPPYVFRYKIAPGIPTWFAGGNTGHISFFVVDTNTEDRPPSHEYLKSRAANVQVTIVTFERVYRVTPPDVTPTCVPGPSPVAASQRPATWEPAATTASRSPAFDVETGVGKYWLVFQHNVATGNLVFGNQYLCRGSTIPNEGPSASPSDPLTPATPTYPLPWPLYWNDGIYAYPR